MCRVLGEIATQRIRGLLFCAESSITSYSSIIRFTGPCKPKAGNLGNGTDTLNRY